MEVVAFRFFLVSLVVWRVTHLLSKEDGPFDLVFILRKKAGAGFFGSLLDCFYCISIWVSLPLGAWLGNTWYEIIIYWWALSGATCLLEQATEKVYKSKSNQIGENKIPEYEED